ncbi:MAG: alpha-amylase family glycosyl hydrolase [Gelidibacter sp.]
MKQLILTVLIASSLIACKDDKKTMAEEENVMENAMDSIPTITKDVIDSAVIYEANIRQYSASGHFDEFTKDIPQLKQLGVKIIWLMPVFPISETKRKATGGADSKFASDFPEAEQAKYLGSYYAVSDFTKINPEFGTIEDFRNLVKTAHDNGMFVILDWVPNHTGWDHVWIKNNPDYYTKDADGNITHPKDTDWTDVADLNYDNKAMRKEMIEDMQYWLREEGVDGFRCDVAGSVPLDFWQEAIPQLRATKSIFMLAEAWEPELFKDDLFDMGYAWDGHHMMNHIAKGEKKASDWYTYLDERNAKYEADDILMNFITNHDENSWNGTISERLGDAAPAMLALEYLTTGMPLIYSGMEYDMDHRLKFFEKDSIPKTKGKMWPLLVKLGTLKNMNPSLDESNIGADVERIDTNNNNVLLFSRNHNGAKLTYLANLSSHEQTFDAKDVSDLTDYMTNEIMSVIDGKLTLKPWEYHVLIN